MTRVVVLETWLPGEFMLITLSLIHVPLKQFKKSILWWLYSSCASLRAAVVGDLCSLDASHIDIGGTCVDGKSEWADKRCCISFCLLIWGGCGSRGGSIPGLSSPSWIGQLRSSLVGVCDMWANLVEDEKLKVLWMPSWKSGEHLPFNKDSKQTSANVLKWKQLTFTSNGTVDY